MGGYPPSLIAAVAAPPKTGVPEPLGPLNLSTPGTAEAGIPATSTGTPAAAGGAPIICEEGATLMHVEPAEGSCAMECTGDCHQDIQSNTECVLASEDVAPPALATCTRAAMKSCCGGCVLVCGCGSTALCLAAVHPPTSHQSCCSMGPPEMLACRGESCLLHAHTGAQGALGSSASPSIAAAAAAASSEAAAAGGAQATQAVQPDVASVATVLQQAGAAALRPMSAVVVGRMMSARGSPRPRTGAATLRGRATAGEELDESWLMRKGAAGACLR